MPEYAYRPLSAKNPAKPGQIVRLKSGGPDMVVTGVNGQGDALVSWTVEGAHHNIFATNITPDALDLKVLVSKDAK